ncbi:hypothetical protein PtA15_11A259 [Puccinia triticina]|uniref:BED-type domain-containing protein n=1 Tax=Puccinia triticina TaxID=208348 RepID=A0ABY7CWC1_9BASI|nr:uncharacterized protein PtA15_11A259 [Puccinia triticina]WAQ89569.1 hypothetical protein PtA15_11A259 [Puccinia triticina]
MVKHSRKRVPEKANMSLFYRKPGETQDKWYCHLCGGGRGSMYKNLHKHEQTETHMEAARRRDKRAHAHLPVDEAPALIPEKMDWTAEHEQPPAEEPPIEPESDNHELGLDLAFIDQDSIYSEETERTGGEYDDASNSTCSSDDMGWNTRQPSNPDQPRPAPHANGQSSGAWGRKRSEEWWPFKAVERSAR